MYKIETHLHTPVISPCGRLTPDSAFQGGNSFFQMVPGGVGQTGVVKPVGTVTQVGMGKGGSLIDGHGDAVPAVREPMFAAVDAAGFHFLAHKGSPLDLLCS